jgi:L-iditol 2-dehydrogenase
MKAFVLTGIKEMEMRDIPDVEIRNDKEVKIRITSVGVCGSDVHYYKTGRIGSQVVQYPFPVGHECAGIVDSVGASVTRVKPGDRIAVEPAMPCSACDQCKAGRLHTCRNLKFLGCPGQADGCLSDSIVMPETNCIPIPEHMSFIDAALSEPLSIGYYANKLSGMDLSDKKIGILGYGPIGMSVHLTAMGMGAEHFYVTDKIDERLAIASSNKTKYTGNPDKAAIVDEISQQEPLLMDIIYECSGEQEAVDQALQLLKPGGKLMLIGIPEIDRFSFEMDMMRRKEICVQNVRRQNDCVEATLQLIADRKLDTSSMHTHSFSFAESKEAFELVMNYRDGVMKAMIEY